MDVRFGAWERETRRVNAERGETHRNSFRTCFASRMRAVHTAPRSFAILIGPCLARRGMLWPRKVILAFCLEAAGIFAEKRSATPKRGHKLGTTTRALPDWGLLRYKTRTMTTHSASMTRSGVRTQPWTDSTAKPTRCVRRAALNPRRSDDDVSTSGEDHPSRRTLLTGLTFSGLALSTSPGPARAAELLSTRLERKDFSKPVFNASRPKAQVYPDWLEGEWNAVADFAGYSFPSTSMNPKLLVKEPTIPGFQKLSLVYVPDVGSTQVRYRMRFNRREPNGPVYEDREFNLESVVTGYLNHGVGPGMLKKVIDEVEYEPGKDPNRATVRLTNGASVNAERIELFTNARESETRANDGTFFCSEALRQVTLGYGREYGTARVVNTDYQHVWTFTPVLYDDDEETTSTDATTDKTKRINKVKVSLSTAGYAQPSDALRLSANAPVNGNAPVPTLGAKSLNAAFEPAVLYSHTIVLERI